MIKIENYDKAQIVIFLIFATFIFLLAISLIGYLYLFVNYMNGIL